MKKLMQLLTILVLILVMAGCQPTKMQPEDPIEPKNTAQQSTLSDLIVRIDNKETFAVILTMDGCPWCEEATPVFKTVVQDYDIPSYYVNFTNAMEEADFEEDFAQLLSIIDRWLTVENGEKAFYVPDAYFFQEGTPINHHLGTVDSHDPSEAKMTETEMGELIDLYRKGFDLLNK